MKAFVQSKYGPPNVLQLKEVSLPSPSANEVLVKVRTTAINDYDWSMVQGKPYVYRLMFGLLKPKHNTPGMELAGTIESMGSNVGKFKIGDEVYGDISGYGFGSFAEYLCIHENALVLKPASLSFEEAAAIPHASLLASQGLIDAGKIEKGQHILVNGAGGGMGTFALYIAKQYDAKVTGVDSGEKLEKMKSIGYDVVIDYKMEDFTKNGKKYDLILDAKTNRFPFRYLRSLKSHGKYVTVGGYLDRILALVFCKGLISRFYGKQMHLVALKPNENLEYISQLFEAGKLKPLIDGPYPFEDIPRLIQYFGEGKHKGKVVVSVSGD